ncbi:hypothetical protein [Actinomadura litoris]|uniref:hypothetical protein n=1 Tax=Actinomadura litoris TaxID=2678616 RepID=UPI001FA805DF|nr:hypothetical protein [Actinomadura litoris]
MDPGKAEAIKAAAYLALHKGPSVQIVLLPALWDALAKGLRETARHTATFPTRREQLVEIASRIEQMTAWETAALPQGRPSAALAVELTAPPDEAFALANHLHMLVFQPSVSWHLRALAQIEGPRLLARIPDCPAVLRGEIDKVGWNPLPSPLPPWGAARRGHGRPTAGPTSPIPPMPRLDAHAANTSDDGQTERPRPPEHQPKPNRKDPK